MEKENLERLLSEKASLGRNLRLAVEAGDGVEISSLKQREKTIESDIYSAEILALQAEIRELQTQLEQANKKLLEAKETSLNTDSLVVFQVEILRGEIKRLNDDAFGKLIAVKTAEKVVFSTSGKLSEVRQKLAKMLQ